MDRKECYRLTHRLSEISDYAIGYQHCINLSLCMDIVNLILPVTTRSWKCALYCRTRRAEKAMSAARCQQRIVPPVNAWLRGDRSASVGLIHLPRDTSYNDLYFVHDTADRHRQTDKIQLTNTTNRNLRLKTWSYKIIVYIHCNLQ